MGEHWPGSEGQDQRWTRHNGFERYIVIIITTRLRFRPVGLGDETAILTARRPCPWMGRWGWEGKEERWEQGVGLRGLRVPLGDPWNWLPPTWMDPWHQVRTDAGSW